MLGRILVVDDSSVVRETLSIVLGPRYDVCTLTCDQYGSGDGGGVDAPDLVVLGAAAASIISRVPADVPVLRLPAAAETVATESTGHRTTERRESMTRGGWRRSGVYSSPGGATEKWLASRTRSTSCCQLASGA